VSDENYEPAQTALALLTAWDDDQDMTAWLSVADSVQGDDEWHAVAAALAGLAHQFAEVAAEYAGAGVTAQDVIRRVAASVAQDAG
jgi:hypothetical protein